MCIRDRVSVGGKLLPTTPIPFDAQMPEEQVCLPVQGVQDFLPVHLVFLDGRVAGDGLQHGPVVVEDLRHRHQTVCPPGHIVALVEHLGAGVRVCLLYTSRCV